MQIIPVPGLVERGRVRKRTVRKCNEHKITIEVCYLSFLVFCVGAYGKPTKYELYMCTEINPPELHG